MKKLSLALLSFAIVGLSPVSVETVSAQAEKTATEKAAVKEGTTKHAASKESFTEERFEELQAEGALILLDVFADWCPTCAKQQEVLEAYQEAHPAVPLHILQIDFDDQKEWVKKFRAPRQSTLILYRGDEQVWFNVAETSREVIFGALNEAAAGL